MYIYVDILMPKCKLVLILNRSFKTTQVCQNGTHPNSHPVLIGNSFKAMIDCFVTQQNTEGKIKLNVPGLQK